MTTTPAMPELPEPDIHHHMMTVWRDDVECEVDLGPRYTADQMRAYALAILQAQPAAADWQMPTTYAHRFTEAVALLCREAPPADMVAGWLDLHGIGADDHRLQDWACERAPAWAQGIGLLDAAHVMADQPTEGVDHEPAQPAAAGVSDATWEGAEEWMPLAWELCAEEHGEEACNELIWTGGPIPEPWGDRWLQYEDEAKRLIALVRKHVPALRPQSESEQEQELRRSLAEAQATISERNAEIIELQKRIRRSPQQVPMTDEAEAQWRFIRDRLNKPGMYKNRIGAFVAWLEAHHGITAHGAQGGEG